MCGHSEAWHTGDPIELHPMVLMDYALLFGPVPGKMCVLCDDTSECIGFLRSPL